MTPRDNPRGREKIKTPEKSQYDPRAVVGTVAATIIGTWLAINSTGVLKPADTYRVSGNCFNKPELAVPNAPNFQKVDDTVRNLANLTVVSVLPSGSITSSPMLFGGVQFLPEGKRGTVGLVVNWPANMDKGLVPATKLTEPSRNYSADLNNRPPFGYQAIDELTVFSRPEQDKNFPFLRFSKEPVLRIIFYQSLAPTGDNAAYITLCNELVAK